MVTVHLTVQDSNAIGAALAERRVRLANELERLRKQPASSNREYAIECNEEALRDTVRATLLVSAAHDDPEYPEDMTFSAIATEDPSVVWHYDLDR